MSEVQSEEFVERLKDSFDEMVVYKDLKKSNFIAAFKLPSFMRDWVLKRFQDDDGVIDIDGATEFIRTFIPKKEDWKAIKNRVVSYQEQVKFLAKISIDIDIKTQALTFALPDFGLTFRDTVIPRDVWDSCNASLLKAEENWGIVELGYQYPENDKMPGKIKLVSFQDFCPYSIDLDDFKYARESFSLDEWIDIVEKRLNMIELAPKGTGKSYLFGSVSRFGWLSSGGTMSRARMFYDVARRTEGLVFGHDYVALDEVQTINFTDVDEMRGALKGYMENGKYTVGNHEGAADSGIILLGNIPASNMNEYINMFSELPKVFHESALIDRFHGFLKGWDLPRMNDDLKICGWALNSEYFSNIMPELRDDPDKSDTRDTEAIKRICTAYLKLLFPQVQRPGDIPSRDFKTYCLEPAIEMRSIIKLQLGILDPDEFRGKDVPTLTIKDIEE